MSKNDSEWTEAVRWQSVWALILSLCEPETIGRDKLYARVLPQNERDAHTLTRHSPLFCVSVCVCCVCVPGSSSPTRQPRDKTKKVFACGNPSLVLYTPACYLCRDEIILGTDRQLNCLWKQKQKSIEAKTIKSLSSFYYHCYFPRNLLPSSAVVATNLLHFNGRRSYATRLDPSNFLPCKIWGQIFCFLFQNNIFFK